MMYMDLTRVLALRGIPNNRKFLMDNGFTPSITHRIINQYDSYIKFEYLEKLCMLLHCSPNDLLSFRPPANANIDKNHPLQQLVHEPGGVLDTLKNAPIEKLSRFKEWLEQEEQKEK